MVDGAEFACVASGQPGTEPVSYRKIGPRVVFSGRELLNLALTLTSFFEGAAPTQGTGTWYTLAL